MPSRSARLLLSLVALFLVTPAVYAHDVTITGNQSFASLDGSSADHDGAANGVFTVSDGNLVVSGVVNCNDDGPGGNSACAMAFAVSGNMTVAGGALYAENRTGAGNGGAITLTVGGNLALTGNAVVSSAATSNAASASGGAINATVAGSVSVGAGSTIDSGSAGSAAGSITVAAGGVVTVDGNVVAGPSRTVAVTRLTGAALTGGGGNQAGGQISIGSITFVEPAIVVGPAANVVSQGETATGSVTLDGCGIDVRGLVASLSRSSAAVVVIRSGKSAVIDGRDLGGAGIRMGRVRADATQGTAGANRVDVFAADAIGVYGPAASHFAVSANAGPNDPRSEGGSVRAVALAGTAAASGNAIDAGGSSPGNGGGSISIASAGDAVLNTATLRAAGDHTSNNNNRDGGSIRVRSHAGNVLWTNGVGDVRPVGSASNLPVADQGSIVLTACGTVNTTGSTFPVNGTATSVHPQTQTGVCSPAAPSLPAGTPPLVTCNTPPVANDTAVSTNEDHSVTVTLTGTDADGDSLTFTVVSGPAHGTVGPVVVVNATTSTVVYTPAPNYNGADSFVFQANDGNGGTDTATATITIAPVNDPPSFLAGPTVSALEDSGAQTYPNWATSISAGPADESGQSVTFTVTNDNPSLFSVQPALSSGGTLTYTPAPNAHGSANITVTAKDDGGTANGGNDTSAPQTSSITVTPVNDAPSFVKSSDQTVSEDAGPQSVAGWATAISAGPNEGSQTVSFVTSNNNNALFSAQPAVSSSGTLTYTPAANASGTATVTIFAKDDGGTANGGVDSSASQTFAITVNSVNDAPSFTSGGNVSVVEDSGAYSAAWATQISAGPADESGQTVSFTASNDNNALFAVQPAVSASGVLTFTLNANASGTATVTLTLSDNGGMANGGVDTSAPQTFTITVDAVNDEPSFTAGGNVTVSEDSGPYSAAWASAISAGPGEGSQTLTFNVSNDNNALFSAQPAISASGVLTFTPAANAFGAATVSVTLTDDGGTANGGDNASATVTFTITIDPVNDAPSFTGGGNVTVNEDSGAYSAPWATGISAGPANESSQTLTFSVSNSNNALFSVQPSVSASGVLTFTVAPNAFGSATVTVTLSDNGGTANGGADTSAPQTFTITVNAVNDAPSFTGGGDVTVNEDSGPYAAPWASGISAGPNESGQTVSFNVSNSNNALFAVQPAISPTGVLTFTPALNAFGSATVTVTLTDNGGTANGGVNTSAAQTFTITVTAVNDGPTANADSWETLGNTEIRVDLPAGLTPHVSDTTPSGNGVRHNDGDPEGDPVVVTGIVGCADASAPFDCTLPGGARVSMLANGSFSYTPAPGASSGSFQYTVTDVPAAGTPATSTGTVTFAIHDMIWYVNGAAAPGGNGTSSAPFTSLAPLNAVGDVDAAGHTIFVHTSAVAGNISLEAGQKLYGQGVGLSKPHNLNGNGSPTVLVAAGVAPTVTSAADVVSVPGVSGVEIAGLTLVSTGGNGIDLTSNPLGSPAGAAIYSNTIAGAAAEGIDINGGSSSANVVSIDNTSISSTGTGLDVSSVGTTQVAFTNGTITSSAGSGIAMDGAGGSLTVTGLSNVTINGNTAADGIRIVNARFDAVAGGSFNTVSTGVVTVGSSANPVGANAVVLNNASGDLAFGTLSAHGTSGVSVSGTGLHTGTSGFRVTSGGGAIGASSGVGLSVTNATIGAAGLRFTSINSTGGVNGIVLNNTGTTGGLNVSGDGASDTADTTRGRTTAKLGGGTVNVTSGGTIQNASQSGIVLNSTGLVVLRNMVVQNNGGAAVNSGFNGIHATAVTGLTLDNVLVTGHTANYGLRGIGVAGLGIIHSDIGNNATAATVENFDIWNVRLTDLGGTSTILSSLFHDSRENVVGIAQSGTSSATINVSNSEFRDTAAASPGNSTLLVEAYGTASTTLAVTNSSFRRARSAGFMYAGNDSSGGSVTVSGSTFDLNGVDVNVAHQGSTLDYAITNNTTRQSFKAGSSVSINVFLGGTSLSTSLLSGTITGNTVGNAAVPNSGSDFGAGIVVSASGAGTLASTVANNVVREVKQDNAFWALSSGHTGSMNLAIRNNDFRVSATSGLGLAGIDITAGTTATDTGKLCIDMSGNTAVGDPFWAGIALQTVAGNPNVKLKGYTGAANNGPAIESFLTSTNASVTPAPLALLGAGTVQGTTLSCGTP